MKARDLKTGMKVKYQNRILTVSNPSIAISTKMIKAFFLEGHAIMKAETELKQINYK